MYGGHKFNAGMAPNVIHSIDGYIVRQLRRKFHDFLATIHDAYGCHYNFVDDLISLWKDEMIFLLDSNILDDIMSQIANGRKYKKVNKVGTLSARHIIESQYGLS
jgi:DNA-directed RNA polymerase